MAALYQKACGLGEGLLTPSYRVYDQHFPKVLVGVIPDNAYET